MNLTPFVALLLAFVAGLWIRDAWRFRKPTYGLEQKKTPSSVTIPPRRYWRF